MERKIIEKKKVLKIFLFVLILGLGLFLRIRQWNDLMIYPDSYHYLMTANNLSFCGKPFYCFMIGVIKLFFFDPFYVARILSLFCSNLSIIAIYFFFERQKNNSGLIASLFFALSFTIVSWTNFILPDSLAILLFLGFLCATRQWVVATILLFLSGLVRPEYLALMPFSIFLYPKNKRAWILSLALFFAGGVYYLFTYDLPSQVLVIKNSFLDFPINIFKYEPALVLSAIASSLVPYKGEYGYKKFFITQLILFFVIFTWNNPSNWRYGMHLIVPLIYFGSSFISYIIKGVVRGLRSCDYILAGFAILFILQFYISYIGAL